MAPQCTRTRPPTSRLRDRLEPLYPRSTTSGPRPIPIELVRPYRDPRDREIAGFIAAGLAFGNVVSVMQSVGAVLERMGPAPAAYVRRFEPRTDGRDFATFVHRWTRGVDVVALLWVLRQMLERSGSVEGFFAEGDDPSTRRHQRRPGVVHDARPRARSPPRLRPGAPAARRRLLLHEALAGQRV